MHGSPLIPLAQNKASDWRKEFVYEYYWERDYPQTPTVVSHETHEVVTVIVGQDENDVSLS